MLLKDVKIGGLYRAKISGNFTNVRILDKQKGGWSGRQTRFTARNQSTGREVTFTAAKLRYEVKVSC